jgi:hypothetical protein
MLDANGRNAAETEKFRRFETRVPCDDFAAAIDNDRVDPPQLNDGIRDLTNLRLRVRSRIAIGNPEFANRQHQRLPRKA